MLIKLHVCILHLHTYIHVRVCMYYVLLMVSSYFFNEFVCATQILPLSPLIEPNSHGRGNGRCTCTLVVHDLTWFLVEQCALDVAVLSEYKIVHVLKPRRQIDNLLCLVALAHHHSDYGNPIFVLSSVHLIQSQRCLMAHVRLKLFLESLDLLALTELTHDPEIHQMASNFQFHLLVWSLHQGRET